MSTTTEKTQKYYLLTFNEDYADEHNVPAQACFNEKDYKKWLKLKTGRENKQYEEQCKKFKADEQLYRDTIAEYQRRGIYNRNRSQLPLTEAEEAFMAQYPLKHVDWYNAPKPISDSFIRAYLGNSGDDFGDEYRNYKTMKDLVDQGYVTVTEVAKEFVDVFNAARLGRLSLCNIFEMSDFAPGTQWWLSSNDDDDNEEEIEPVEDSTELPGTN
jgi:hypothetical protein